MAEHERSCDHKIVRCEYGCQEEMKLKDLDKHNRDYSHNHLVFGLRGIAERGAAIERRLEEIEGGYRDIIGYRGHLPMRMKDFDQMKNENKGWLSPCFYSSPRGYKMALVIYSNGINQGFGSHLSCFACFLSGEHDDGLQWPFRGKITITLLNQLMDRYHKRLQITLTNNTPPSQTIIEGQPCDIFGESQFIPHSQLRVNSFGNCQYLKDDSLYFRVNVEVISDTRPWLAQITYH
jgi:TNF receptor-associated factor 4